MRCLSPQSLTYMPATVHFSPVFGIIAPFGCPTQIGSGHMPKVVAKSDVRSNAVPYHQGILMTVVQYDHVQESEDVPSSVELR
jgi:hypothetical protein